MIGSLWHKLPETLAGPDWFYGNRAGAGGARTTPVISERGVSTPWLVQDRAGLLRAPAPLPSAPTGTTRPIQAQTSDRIARFSCGRGGSRLRLIRCGAI